MPQGPVQKKKKKIRVRSENISHLLKLNNVLQPVSPPWWAGAQGQLQYQETGSPGLSTNPRRHGCRESVWDGNTCLKQFLKTSFLKTWLFSCDPPPSGTVLGIKTAPPYGDGLARAPLPHVCDLILSRQHRGWLYKCSLLPLPPLPPWMEQAVFSCSLNAAGTRSTAGEVSHPVPPHRCVSGEMLAGLALEPSSLRREGSTSRAG